MLLKLSEAGSFSRTRPESSLFRLPAPHFPSRTRQPRMTPSARQTKLVAAGTAPGSLHASSAIAPLARRAHRRSHSPRAEDHHAIVEKRSQQQPSQSRTTPAPAKNLSRPAARQWPLARTSTALPDSRRFVRALNDTSERLNGHAGIAWLEKSSRSFRQSPNAPSNRAIAGSNNICPRGRQPNFMRRQPLRHCR